MNLGCRDAITGKFRLFHDWRVEFLGIVAEVQCCRHCLARRRRVW